jgi:chromosome segregation ATPase
MSEESLARIESKIDGVIAIQSGFAEGQSRLEQRQANLEEGQSRLEQRQANLEGGQSRLEQRQANLEEGQSRLEQRQANLEEGQSRLEQRQTTVEQGHATLATGLEEVRVHLIRVDRRLSGVDSRLDGVDRRLEKLEVGQEEMRGDIRQIAEGHAVTQAAIARATETVIAHIDKRIDPLERAVRAHFGTR